MFRYNTFVHHRACTVFRSTCIPLHSICFPFSKTTPCSIDWTDVISPAVGALIGSVGTFFGSKWIRERELRKTIVGNIIKGFEKKFESPLKPKYGPVFHRKEWEEEFKKLCENDMYQLYYGPSGLGKSLAVAQALSKRPGVAYVNLREANGDSLIKSLAKALNFSGPYVTESNKFLVPDLLAMLEEAARELNQKSIKPVIIIEDIHSMVDVNEKVLPRNAALLAAGLMDFHNMGLINVIYTVSDFNAIEMLSSVSGHSSRLKVHSFPFMPDNELTSQLMNLGLTNKGLLFLHESSTDKKLLSIDDINLIVEKIGCHMGNLTDCLRDIAEHQKSVKDTVDKILKEQIGRFFDAFPAELVEKAPSFIIAANHLFKSLGTKGNGLEWPSEYKYVSHYMSFEELQKAIGLLVRRNLLSYISHNTVTFHSRALHWAFQQFIINDDRWKLSIVSAEGRTASAKKTSS